MAIATVEQGTNYFLGQDVLPGFQDQATNYAVAAPVEVADPVADTRTALERSQEAIDAARHACARYILTSESPFGMR